MKNTDTVKMKSLFSLISLVFISTTTFAQPMSFYSFSTSNQTYVPLQGGTELGNSLNYGISFPSISLGFDFNFGGLISSEITVHSGGYIKVGSPITYPFDNYSPLTDFNTDDYIISALGTALGSDNATGKLSYLTSGVTPNRVFVVDWNDYESSFVDHSFNFQLKLYETTNIIEFHYGNFDFLLGSPLTSLQVGLRGARSTTPQDINQRRVSQNFSTWNTSTSAPFDQDAYADLYENFVPENGLLYTWNPPANCSGTPIAGTAVASAELLCAGQELTLSLSGIPNYTFGISYAWEYATDGVNYTALLPSSSPVFDTLFSNTITYRSVVACNGVSSVSTAITINAILSNSYATLPFLETFEADWEERCGTLVPNLSNWSSNGTFGEMSWKQDSPPAFSLPSFSGKAAIFENVFGNGSSLPNISAGDLDLYISLPGQENYSLSFNHINTFDFSSRDSLIIYLSIDGGVTFVKKAKFVSNAGNPTDAQWNKKYVPLGVTNSANCIIRFRTYTDFSYLPMAIDNVEVSVCPVFNVQLTTSSDTICRGASASITASGAETYLWDNGQTSSSITINPFSSNIYSILGITGNCSAANEVVIYVEDCTSLYDFENSDVAVSLMPNPTSGATTIKFNTTAIRNIYIVDISGKIIQSFQSKNQLEVLPTEDLASGIYVVRIVSETNQNQFVKLIKN